MKQYQNYFSTKGQVLLFLCCSLLIWSCSEGDKTAAEIEKIDLELSIARFDREFADAKAEGLPHLKQKYPYLFPAQYPDSVWIAKMNDTIQEEISSEVVKVFEDFEAEEEELTQFFKHVKYYFPNYNIPNIVTVTNLSLIHI